MPKIIEIVDDDELPPELEDDVPAPAVRHRNEDAPVVVTAPPPPPPPPAAEATPAAEEGPTLMEQMMEAATAAKAAAEAKRAAERAAESKSFGEGLSAKAMFRSTARDVDTGRSTAALEAKLLKASHLAAVPDMQAALSAGANPNCKAPTAAGQTPLCLAVFSGKREAVQLLLDSGADVNVCTKTSKSPLMVAAQQGLDELVTLLLENGAYVDAVDQNGKTASQLAAGARSATIVQLLGKPGWNKKPAASAASNSSSKTADDIPMLKPTAPADASGGLRLPEVQQAMAGMQSKLSQDKSWMTPELMKRIAANPILSRGLADPAMAGILQEAQTNPAIMSRYKNNPQVQAFLKAFFEMMGDHFTTLGAKEDAEREAAAKAVPTPIASKPVAGAKAGASSSLEGLTPDVLEEAASTADADVAQVLKNPELVAILTDPSMQRVLQEAAQPGKLSMFMSDPQVGPKLRKLFAAGLVKFA